MPKEKLNHLTPRTQIATDYYIAKNLASGDKNYTYAQAMRDAGYSPHYVIKFAIKIANNAIVKQQINSFVERIQNRIIEKTAITHEFINSKHLQYIKEAEEQTPKDLVLATTNLKLLGDSIGHYKTGIYDAGDKMQEIDDKIRLAAASIPDSYLLKSPERPKLVESTEISASQDAAGLTNDVKSDAEHPPEQ